MNEHEFSPKLPPAGQPLSDIRAYRLRSGVRLIDLAVYSGISMTRASEIERFPERARAGEIEILRQTVDRIVAERERLASTGGAA